MHMFDKNVLARALKLPKDSRGHVVLKSSLCSLLAMLVLAPEKNMIVVEVMIFSLAMIS